MSGWWVTGLLLEGPVPPFVAAVLLGMAGLDPFECGRYTAVEARRAVPLRWDNPGHCLVKRVAGNPKTHHLVISQGYQDQNRSIRLNQEQHFLQDVEMLRSRMAKGKLKKTALINQAVGRLRERPSRVRCYYRFSYQAAETMALPELPVDTRSRLVVPIEVMDAGAYPILSSFGNDRHG